MATSDHNVRQNYKYLLVGHFLHRQLVPSVGKTLYVQHFLVIEWPTFLPPSPWRAQAIRLASAHWSFPHSHPLGCRFHPSSSHPRPFSSEAWTSSPTGSVCYTSARRLATRHPSEGRPPSTLGCVTSMTRHLCFFSSKLFAQTPL